MSFAERLRKSGFHTRYQTIEYPLVVRANKNDGDDEEEEKEENDGLTLRGTAVPFNSPTRINDWLEGEFDEQFAPGAFKRTISHGHQIMQFDHGSHPLIGSLPIASIRRLEETKTGLDYTARMFDNWLTEPLRDGIRERAITGNSIRFRVIKELIEEREDDVPLVTVQEADLREFGPVMFPAYPDTPIELRSDFESSVRHAVEKALQQHDAFLRGEGPKRESTSSGGAHLVQQRKSLAAARLRLREAQL